MEVMRLPPLLFALLTVSTTHGVPIITQQPQSTAVRAGQPATLTVAATGVGSIAYQWRRDGFAIAGATNASITIGASSQSDNGSYDATVTDSQQTVTTGIVLLRVSPRETSDVVVLDQARSSRIESPDGGFFQDAAFLADGRSFVTGNFVRIDGARRNRLARFTPTGALDLGFEPPSTDGVISILAAQPDGKLVIGGSFSTVGGQTSGGIARLNTDGSLDRSFDVGIGISGAQQRYLRAIAIAPDGGILVSGSFPNGYKGRAVPSLFKLTAQGALVEGFSAPANLADGPLSFVFTANGGFYASSVSFITSPGVNTFYGIARFLANGAHDPTFPHLTTDQFNPYPFRLLRVPDGSLIAYGAFSQIGGANRNGFARIVESGGVAPSIPYNMPPGSFIRWAAPFPNGDLLVSGQLYGRTVAKLRLNAALDTTFNAPAYTGVEFVHVMANGSSIVASSFLQSESGFSRAGADVLRSDGSRASGSGVMLFPAAVNFMQLLSGGKIVVGGSFTHWNGEATGSLVRLNPDLSRDRTFRIGSGPNGRVTSGAALPDSKILAFGRFTQVGGFVANGAVRLLADGAPDPTFSASAPSLYQYLRPPAVLRDRRILVPAYVAPRSFLLFGADGASIPAESLVPNSSGDGNIWAASVLPNGQLLVGGTFQSWNAQGRRHLVRLNPDGTLDASFATNPSQIPDVFRFDATGAAAQSNGRLLLVSQSPPQLRRFDAAGNPDPQFANEVPPGGFLVGHIILPDDRILVWGTTNNGSRYLIRLLQDGRSDPSFVVIGQAAFDTSSVTVTDGGEIIGAADGELVVFAPSTAPVLTRQPQSVSLPAGGSGSLSVTVAGSAPVTYQWTFNGQAIAGATDTTLNLSAVTPASAGTYRVVATDSRGSTTSAPGVVSVDTSANRTMRLSNVSVRARVTAQPMIVGFVVSEGTKSLLVRGIGPTLAQFGVTGVLPNPQIKIYRGATLSDQNDNWGGDGIVATAAAAVSAFPLPASSLDAALMRDFLGAQTVHLEGGTGAGVALAEIYDTAPVFGGAPRITNVSARYQVGTAENILIAGFSIVGAGNKALLVRGIGPTLGLFGVGGSLNDPQLAIFTGTTRVTENNDWGGTSALAEAFASVGAFPLAATSRDAAVVVYLPAGSYTAQLSGVGGTTGEGLIEIYELP